MMLVLPTTDAFGVKGDNREYNGHGHQNKNKACSYEEAYPTWADFLVAGC